MKELERTLRKAGRRDVSQRAAAASRAFAESTVEHGVLDVAYTTIDSPVGPMIVAATPRGVVRIAFARTIDPDSVLHELSDRISPRVLEAHFYFDGIRRELDEYFEGRRTRFDLPIDWVLTGGFGRRVLKRTARIPYGEVSTYRNVAADAGSPQGARAAGNALGANPIAIVVPCHRVVQSGGALGGYGGGPATKRFLLQLEGAV